MPSDTPDPAALARELIELREKATPVEWYTFRHEHGGDHSNRECYRIDIRGNPVRLNGKTIGSTPVCVLHSGFVCFENDAEFIIHAANHAADLMRWALEQHEEAVAARNLLDKICDAPLRLEIVKQEAERLRERVAKLEGGIKMLRHYTQYGIDNQTAAKLDASDFIRIREACTEYLKESPT